MSEVKPISDEEIEDWKDRAKPQPGSLNSQVFARIEADKAEIERLRGALNQQHQWQVKATGIYMLYLDKDQNPTLMDISQEYSDSSMCENTTQALSGAKP